MKHRLMVVDDHTLFREGLSGLLREQPDMEVMAEAGNGKTAVETALRVQPDLVLMDISMPELNGVDAALAIKQAAPQVRVLMLTMLSDDDHLFAAIKGGADGYLLKTITTREMLDGIRAALRGEVAVSPSLASRIIREMSRGPVVQDAAPAGHGLTAREMDVLKCVVTGATNKEIAAELYLSEHTVKTHLSRVLEKLHLANRAEAADYALRKGLVRMTSSDPR